MIKISRSPGVCDGKPVFITSLPRKEGAPTRRKDEQPGIRPWAHMKLTPPLHSQAWDLVYFSQVMTPNWGQLYPAEKLFQTRWDGIPLLSTSGKAADGERVLPSGFLSLFL